MNLLVKWPTGPRLYLNIKPPTDTGFNYYSIEPRTPCNFISADYEDSWSDYLALAENEAVLMLETEASSPNELVKLHPELFL